MTRSGPFVSLLLGGALLASCSQSLAASDPGAGVSLPFDRTAFSKDLERIASIDRTTGTAGENEAIDYIAAELSKASVEWKIEPFQAYVSFPLTASLTIGGVSAGEALTYSFTGNTAPGGVTGRLAVATVGPDPDGDPAGGIGLPKDCHGLIVMVDSWPLPEVARKIERCGATGAVFTSQSAGLINFIASPVWGTPSDRNVATLPAMPGLTLRRQDFLALAERAKAAPMTVTLSAQASREWRTLRLLTATVAGKSPEYVLVGSHIDSWDYGATDNGVANAMILAFARALRKGPMLPRSVKFAWWPGHSQGRYAGSAWFADAHWAELDSHAVAYLNEDVLGSRDADRYTLVSSAEFEGMAASELAKTLRTVQPLQRPGRYADSSFFGVGVPTLSLVHGKGEAPSDWWHDSHDTLDKVSMAAIEEEYRAVSRLLTGLAVPQVLQARFTPLADQILARLTVLQADAAGRFSLDASLIAAKSFRDDAVSVDTLLAAGRIQPSDRQLMEVSRALNPVLYTSGDRFEPDEAISQPLIPALASAIRLGALSASDGGFARVTLSRGQARVIDALERARAALRSVRSAQ